MLIIFEGADGTGKTTLINRLIKDKVLDCKVTIPRGANHQMELYHALKDSEAICGADRSFISDIVYRLVDDGIPEEFTLDSVLNLLDWGTVKIVLCNTPKSFEYAQARGEDFITDPKVHKRICDIYDALIKVLRNYTKANICKYDFAKDRIENVIKFINE